VYVSVQGELHRRVHLVPAVISAAAIYLRPSCGCKLHTTRGKRHRSLQNCVIARATPQINYFVARGSNFLRRILPTELCESAQLETLDFAPFFPQETLSAQFSSASQS
jgi:hypothetical protein